MKKEIQMLMFAAAGAVIAELIMSKTPVRDLIS
jgi:hypothetical protein